MNIHPCARTTPKIRKEIQNRKGETAYALSKEYNVTAATIIKWQSREDTHDRSHRPHKLNTRLTELQELILVEIRKILLLPLDDLLAVAREFIDPGVSRAGLHRTLKRYNVSNLKQMQAELEPEANPQKKTFKDYKPGFVHVDVKYLPQMPDEDAQQYLFVAIDRASRWVYFEIHRDKSAQAAQAFLQSLIKAAPFKITKVLTDNGKEFTDRYCVTGERKPTGNHPFDKVCQQANIEHRLIKPRHPQTNGMVERFNGRISELLASTHFQSSEELKEALMNYLSIYNEHIPQKNLGHVTPVKALEKWQQKCPELFKGDLNNLLGLEI